MQLQITYPPARSVNQVSSLDRLNKYILDKPIHQIPTYESSYHKNTRRSVQVAASVIGGCGNLTFVNITGKLAENNQAYKWSLVAGNTISFGTVTAWVLLKLVNSSLRPCTKEESELLQAQTSTGMRGLIKMTAIVAGLISQIPVAYIAYVYNNNNIIYPIVILTSNASLPIHSLELTFDAFVKARRYTEFEKTLIQTKKELIQMLGSVKEAVETMTPQDRDQFLQEIRTIATSGGSEEDKIIDYLNKLRDLYSKQPLQQGIPFWVRFGEYTTGAVGLALSVSLLSHYWMGGYKAAELADEDNSAFKHTSAGFVTFCNAYLTVDLVVKSTLGIFNGIVNSLRKTTKPGLSMQLCRNTTAFLRVIAAASAALSYGASVQFSKDYFSGGFGSYIEVTATMGNIAFVSSGMFACIEEAISEYFLHQGNNHQKASFGLQNEMNRLIHLIDRCSTLDFAKTLLTWQSLMPVEWNQALHVPEKAKLIEFIQSKKTVVDETTELLQEVN